MSSSRRIRPWYVRPGSSSWSSTRRPSRLLLKRGSVCSTFSRQTSWQCIVPLFANAGLLLNADTPHWRRNTSGLLTRMRACTLWMIVSLSGLTMRSISPGTSSRCITRDIILSFRARNSYDGGAPPWAVLTSNAGFRLRFWHTWIFDSLRLIWWSVPSMSFVVLPWLFTSAALGQYNHTSIWVPTPEHVIVRRRGTPVSASESGRGGLFTRRTRPISSALRQFNMFPQIDHQRWAKYQSTLSTSITRKFVSDLQLLSNLPGGFCPLPASLPSESDGGILPSENVQRLTAPIPLRTRVSG